MSLEERTEEGTHAGQEQESMQTPGADESKEEEPQSIEALQRALEEERSRAESYYAHWQRSQADFINYKRRTEQERGDAVQYAQASVFASLLSIIDDFERALESIPVQFRSLTWTDGVALIYRKLQALLEAYGVEKIPTEGEHFDPHQHEAILQGPGPEGQVMAEIQKGYRMNGRVIRPSLVQVGDGSSQAPGPADGVREVEDQTSGDEGAAS